MTSPSTGLANYSAVVPGVLYGSAFPSSEGVRELLSLPDGIRPKTVVNLTEGEHPQAAELVSRGIDAIHLPVEDFAAPSMDQMQRFAAITKDESKWPVLVHCKAGIGRTGTMLAVGLAVLEQIDEKVHQNVTASGGVVPYLRTLRKGAVEVPAQAAAVEAFMHAQPSS